MLITLFMEENKDRIKQYCLFFLDNLTELDENATNEEYHAYISRKYTLLDFIDVTDIWKTVCCDMIDALFAIDHPQANYISQVLYNSIFIPTYRVENNIRLNKIWNILKDNPLSIIHDI
jgi:hypothetical protein